MIYSINIKIALLQPLGKPRKVEHAKLGGKSCFDLFEGC